MLQGSVIATFGCLSFKNHHLASLQEIKKKFHPYYLLFIRNTVPYRML